MLGVPVVDHWWQTETGWPIAANLRGLEPMPIKPGSPSVPVPGYDVRVLDARRRARCRAGTEGAICLRLPLPPGHPADAVAATTSGTSRSYLSAFPGYYLTGDGGYRDEDGYLYVMGRTDDVINVAGHRLSTGSMEAVLAGAPGGRRVRRDRGARRAQGPGAARASSCSRRGWTPTPSELQAELVPRVRDEIGAVAGLRQVDVVPALPKTRSGKILRRTMREIADGGDPAVPCTIEDPAVLEALTPVLRGR